MIPSGRVSHTTSEETERDGESSNRSSREPCILMLECECCMFLRSHLLCSMLTKAAMITRTSQEGARGRVLHVPQEPSPVFHVN
ncbi:hypothetical protein J6590_058746 [Homalodisca vitripennis]|nr:hypothetical protein J6590_058746 [Homalodisca vitripennis]